MAPKKRPARKRRNPVPSQDESGKTPDAITGITERKQMEEALRQSEQRYRRLFEDSRDAIFITSRSGRFLAINQAAADLLGYTREELLELDVEKLYADSADRHRFQQQIEREGSVADYEVRLRRQDGTELECLLTSSVWWDEDGGITGYQGILRDITEQRKTEKQLLVYQQQLRSLATQLSLAEEQERRRIAADLHDRIGQALSLAQTKLAQLQALAPASKPAGVLDEILALIDETIQDTQGLTFELSPPVLYELGLEAAVEWLAEQFQAQHGLRIEVDDDGQPKEVEDNVRALVYRAVRELLLNAVKHAQAQNARVSLRREDDKLHVEVADDGRGFDPTAGNAEDLSGFGLFSIHERMDFIGGSFQIDSAPGQGTRGVVAVPLKHEEASPGGE